MGATLRGPARNDAMGSVPAYWLRVYAAVSFVVLAWVACLWVWRLRATWNELYFDDAYMFLRYATNIKHGLGIAWNLDGVPTYGMTAPLWGAVVLGASYLPLRMANQLMLSSWLCAIGAMAAMAWAVAANAKSFWMSKLWRVLPWVALPLSYQLRFYRQALTGMETMLAVLLGSVYVGAAIGWERGSVKPAWVGLAGTLFFLTRPEAGIAIVLMPLMLLWLMPGVKWQETAILLGVFLACVAVYAVACKLYFHTVFPLSFYEKGLRGYEGYAAPLPSRVSLLAYLTGAPVYLTVVVLLVRRTDWRLLCCCMVPALVACLYLTTTLQIMGASSRYYEAYLGFFVVPSLLLLDSWIVTNRASRGMRWPVSQPRMRGMIIGILLFFSLLIRWHKVTPWLRRIEAPVYAYDPAVLHKGTAVPLPIRNSPWGLEGEIARNLPYGATVADSEVGYLGVSAAQLNVIDLVGLNDTEIALHGFRMDALLARKPDAIYFPHPDYSYECGQIFEEPQLYEQYDVYYERGGPRLALRKASPNYGPMMAELQAFWRAKYPEYAMEDYRVRSASWSREKHRLDADAGRRVKE